MNLTKSMLIGIILILLLVWGLIGSSQTSKAGTTCDIGIPDDKELFCWKWHRNVIGDIQDSFTEYENARE